MTWKYIPNNKLPPWNGLNKLILLTLETRATIPFNEILLTNSNFADPCLLFPGVTLRQILYTFKTFSEVYSNKKFPHNVI